MTNDWTKTEDADLGRPYTDHIEKVTEFALNDIKGAHEADILIIINDQSGAGM